MSLPVPIRHFVVAVLAVIAALVGPARLNADPAPLTFTQTVKIDGRKLRLPIELYLTANGPQRIDVKVAGNLQALQNALPSLLSGVVQETCTRRIALQIDDVKAEDDGIRLTGRAQIQLFSCDRAGDQSSRRRLISNTTDVSARLDGQITDDCVQATLTDLNLQPRGIIGGFLNLTRLTERITVTVRTKLNDKLNAKDSCITLPESLKLLNTQIASGGFRDFGSGQMGFVLKGNVRLDAANIIALLHLLDRKGALGD